MHSLQLLLVASQALSCGAHMFLAYPPALRASTNPFSKGNTDPDITSPLKGSSDYPCKGSLSLLGTSQASSVAEWTAGESYNMTIQGGAPHGGGSCQASISTDQGKTFTVIHSFIGDCPGPEQQSSSFSFRLPGDTPASKDAIFGWTWFNKIGNREMYMNCAVVSISAGSGSEKVAFGDRPAPFVANINGCRTVDSEDVLIPNPGPDVDSMNTEAVAPTGDCEKAASPPFVGGPSSSSGSDSSDSSETSRAPVATSAISEPSETSDGDSGPVVPSSAATSELGGSATEGVEPTSAAGLPPSQTSSGDWTPGNDWPAGFSNARHAAAMNLVLLLAGVFAVFLV
ncbi:hypothetical protein NKR23_g6260 [Pleurostoma richardsiae]|uniref:Extracellular protein n=1 Tax=Pleurostoma richardsiae TaxID=41990 RepID=A0AA38RZ59_9PEZI|nr:hypothetical protein NKR23_g6260 [Pleurostoma richardsiae]